MQSQVKKQCQCFMEQIRRKSRHNVKVKVRPADRVNSLYTYCREGLMTKNIVYVPRDMYQNSEEHIQVLLS
jgi:hypothetical protein